MFELGLGLHRAALAWYSWADLRQIDETLGLRGGTLAKDSLIDLALSQLELKAELLCLPSNLLSACNGLGSCRVRHAQIVPQVHHLILLDGHLLLEFFDAEQHLKEASDD